MQKILKQEEVLVRNFVINSSSIIKLIRGKKKQLLILIVNFSGNQDSSQLTIITCSKARIKTLDKGVKYLQS